MRFGAALAGDCAIGTIMAARTVDTTKRVTKERPGREPERREAIAAVSRINTSTIQGENITPSPSAGRGTFRVPVPGYLPLPNNGHGAVPDVPATVLRRPPRDGSGLRAGQPMPSPVIRARVVRPKQMNAAHANGTHDAIRRVGSKPTRLALPARATMCANTNSSSGSRP